MIHSNTESPLQVTPDLNRKYMQDEGLLHRYFALQSANIIRSKAAFTLVFVSIHSFHEFAQRYGMDISRQALQQINEFLLEQTRNSDLIFQLSQKNKWVFTLPHSGQEEAKYFLKRIFQHIPFITAYGEQELSIALSASIVEIANSKSSYEEVLVAGEKAIQQALEKGPFEIHMVEKFKEREVEKIKVSIIEYDEMLKNVLLTMLERMDLDYFDLDIQTFNDGDQFLQSTWYQSAHTHLVLMSDVLPKKNGVEVLHELRRMPNQKKYIIFMLSNLKAEEEMISAYETGVDEYISKPFNVKLVEARLKQVVQRIRL